MPDRDLARLLDRLRALPRETEWVEFKENKADPEDIGEYISALSNSAALHEQPAAYLVWGIEDGTHQIVGTTFRPRATKIGNEEIENWLLHQLTPRIELRIHELDVDGHAVVIFEIQPCTHLPVRFRDTEWIRVGSYKKKLRDHPEKERAIWLRPTREQFEDGIAASDLDGDDVLRLVDYPAYFELVGRPLADGRDAILDQLGAERIVRRHTDGRFDVTNLGALLFARRLSDFAHLGRKAVRVIEYEDGSRVHRRGEHVHDRGYAVGFASLVDYINARLPRSEVLGQALRREVRAYPELAVRELLANAVVHQDLAVRGTGPLIELFPDRLEFTNPGEPLIDVLRFLDAPPRSRNEAAAAMMRRLGICEEVGSGIDKVVFVIEMHQLPAPEFITPDGFTRAVLFGERPLAAMDSADRMRACYLHACLERVSGRAITNASLRRRFGIEDRNYSVASRIIAETMRAGLVKPYAPESQSRKHARYLPFWA